MEEKMNNINCSPFIARFWQENKAFAWPDVDIAETDNDYTFSFDLPGTLKDDIKIWLENDILTISGEKKASVLEDKKLLISERPFGRFERSFKLSKVVDRNKVSAQLVDGVLVITVPKAIEAKPREISVN
jgi:HSP20 family protein